MYIILINIFCYLAPKRVFIGGLNEKVTAKEITDRFSPFGTVQTVEFIHREDGSSRGFAYANLSISDRSFKRCQTTYMNSKWRGMTLKISDAKDNHVVHVLKERALFAENERHILKRFLFSKLLTK